MSTIPAETRAKLQALRDEFAARTVQRAPSAWANNRRSSRGDSSGPTWNASARAAILPRSRQRPFSSR